MRTRVVSTGRADELWLQEKLLDGYKGATEFGPSCIGRRSILGMLVNRDMQSVMNLKIKYRESFRPFAPSVLRERVV